jgi:hypothetical protein
VVILKKQREIIFDPLHPDPNQAQTATLALNDFNGIEQIDVLSPLRLIVRYHLSEVTLADIEFVLRELGFHLDNSLLSKMKRALYAYTEETERANHGYSSSQGKTTRDVFIKQYQKRPHGCRDPRPSHWRDYL